ncbi:hypothetical protein [Enterobacter kobei]|uniref:hypothetical protein n=1 Tax=Enterobacter kobei TaxID=208224 RepID=UPI002FD1399F
MKTFTIGWLNKCRCGNKSHTVKTARGNETALWDDDAVKCISCGRGGVIQVCEGQARVLWETDEEMAEGKPMSTITREQLRERAREKVKSLEFAVTQTAFADSRAELEEELELARIALASLEAEAVAYIRAAHNPDGFCFADGIHPAHRHQKLPLSTLQDGCYWTVTPLYTAPPAPVSVPDDLEMKPILTDDGQIVGYEYLGERYGVTAGCAWNTAIRTFRAAMLQGTAGNSPAIPDAYEIKSFGFFSAVAGYDGLILQIENFIFDSGKLSQPEIGDFVPRLALQAIINKLQEHCDKLGNRPLDNVLLGLGWEE